MVQNLKKKVCLIVDCLSNGGAERAVSELSVKLNALGYEVSIISLRNQITYRFCGKLYNLGYREPRLKQLKQLVKLYRFKKAYKQVNADVYIDFRMRNRPSMEWLFHQFVFHIEKHIMAIRSYNVFFHIPKSQRFYMVYNKAKAIVGVSEAIKKKLEEVYPFKNLISIPNFYNQHVFNNVTEIDEESVHFKDYLVAVGRLDNNIKQFDQLILAYKNSVAFKKGMGLYILGIGKDEVFLNQLIREEGLQNKVKLVGYTNAVYRYIKKAKCLMLSSKFEGFPNVVLEALALGTPVISFNCKSGPSEMIQHKKNGLLVKDQDFEAFTKAINLMQEDELLYNSCKNYAKESVQKFSEEAVLKKWVKLIEA